MERFSTPKLLQELSTLSGEDLGTLKNEMQNFATFMMMYNSAIKEVRTKLEILSDDLSVIENRNPIETIKSRVKKPESIFGKLRRKGYELTVNSILENLNDVAGIRVICSFVDDIYKVSDMLSRQDDINVIEVKDYIKNPKSNGYRSYHMILEIPVFFADHKRPMRVEVQFRTIAMDFWASLEHQMKYKKDIDGSETVVAQLKECADVIAETDLKMQEINKKLAGLENL